MDIKKAENAFQLVYDYCKSIGALDERELNSPKKFKQMTCEEFLAAYCWVVYASGFRKKVIEKVFPTLRRAYQNFDLQKITQMTSLDEVLAVFNNVRKAKAFISGAKKIGAMGYDTFKERVSEDWLRHLSALNGIGAVTVHHLAMDIGFDTVKPDLHLTRVSNLLGARDPFELAQYLSDRFNKTKMVIDAAFFEFCESKAYKKFGYATIDEFIQQRC
jgi:endonuclease III